MAAAPVALDDATRAAAHRRALGVLFFGQVMGSAGFASAVTVGGLIVKDLLGGSTYAGAASAAMTFGAAAASLPLARLMRRRGRRPGMQLGYGIAVGGAIAAIAGAQHRFLALFLAGLFAFGCAQAANLLARYAAADLALPQERGRAISILVTGSTFGAVFSPTLVGPAGRVAEAIGLWKLTGPFLFSVVFLAAAWLNTAVRLRPDPLFLAGGVVPSGEGAPKPPPVAHAFRVIRRSLGARLAVSTMVVSQAAMVAVMTMTPIHMKDHGHSTQLAGFVVAVHVAGMYALSPLVGAFVDRLGALPVIVGGSVVLAAATIVSAVAGAAPSLLFLGLFLLGLGWSCGLVAGTSLLTASVSAEDRLPVQGSADLLMSFCGGIAGFSSGFVKQALGYHVLSNVGTVGAVALLLVTLSIRRGGRLAAAPA